MKKLLLLLSLFCAANCFGQYKYAKVFNLVKDFGAIPNNATINSTAVFNAAAKAINDLGGNCTLVIPNGIYYVGKQEYNTVIPNGGAWGVAILHLLNVSNVQVVGQSYTSINYVNGLRFGSFDPSTKLVYKPKMPFTNITYANTLGQCILVENCNNVSVENLNLNGNCYGAFFGGQFGDTGYQLDHDGLFIFNSSNTSILNVSAKYFLRDGIMISNKTDSINSTNTTLTNCNFMYNGRDGLSWVNGIGVTATNCTFSSNGRINITSSPCSGVDIESELQIIRHGHFINCKFEDNAGNGLVADSGDSGDCDFTGCTFTGTTSWSNWTVKPNFTYRNCTFSGSIVNGYGGADTTAITRYYNCLFTDKYYNGKPVYGRFLAEISGVTAQEFHNCTFEVTNKMLWWMSATKYSLIDSCTINIRNTDAMKTSGFMISMIGGHFINTKTNIFNDTPIWGADQLTNIKDLGGNTINYLTPSTQTWNYK